VARPRISPASVLEHVTDEREVLGARLPERRQLVVEHGVGEQPPDQPVLAFHRREVAGRVAAGERQPDDQVVEHEVVEDDDPGPLAQCVDDPAVRLGVVADVVERDVGCRVPATAAGYGDDHVDALLQLGEQQRRVVGDPRARWGHRRVVGDLHAATAGTAISWSAAA
jgi:hypothetical protein